MTCWRCGAVNDKAARFCTECGAPLPADGTVTGTTPLNGRAPVSSPMGSARPVPLPPAPSYTTASSNTIPPSSGPSVTVTPAVPHRRRARTALIVALVAAIALVVTGGGLLVGYQTGVWGGRTLPDSADLPSTTVTDADGNKTSVVKAKDVTAALKAKGLTTRTEKVFSGQDAGTFIGYGDGVRQGDRVRAGATIVVRESAGPGVPKNAIGTQKDDRSMAATLANMGVPLHYKKVIVSADSKTKENEVVATNPAAGQPVAKDAMDDGITIGVAVKGDGVPLDIAGMGKDEAKTLLERQGYDVTLEPHFAAKRYIGKISGSDPAPGTPLESGESVTLYYGVGASDVKALFSEQQDGYEIVKQDSGPMLGTYCKAQVSDRNKDCITLERGPSPYGGYSGTDAGYLQIKGREPDSKYDVFGMTNYSQNPSSNMFGSIRGESEDQMPMRNHLLIKNWGMFELYAGMGLANCGDVTDVFGVGQHCEAGKYSTYDPNDGFPSSGSTGLTYKMKDFLVYVPVGSDLQKLEDSGYFDSGALAAAKKQKTVDTSRPFIIMRDKSQYRKTEVSADGIKVPNPFVPGNFDGDGTNHLVTMKPAPSDATVYYLDDAAGIDWSKLADAEPPAQYEAVDGGSNGSSDSGSSSAAAKAMFKEVAGNYSWPSAAISRTDLTLRSDGTFHAAYTVADDENVAHLNTDTPSTTVNVTGRFSSIRKTDTGYTLKCDAESLKVADGGTDKDKKGSGMAPCGTWRWYSGDTTLEEIRDATGAWGVGGLDPSRKAVVLAADHGSGALFLRMS